MQRAEPLLQHRLLAWLLGPLALLLVIDAAAAYWSSLRLADRAYDRALHEIARELVLHVRNGAASPQLELTPATAKLLLTDQDDRLFFRLRDARGAAIGGDNDLPDPPREPRGSQPQFYGATLRGEPVRAVAASLPVGEAPGAPQVQVVVAETLNKRTRLTWEMVAHVVLPQLLLIGMAAGLVQFGVTRGLRPLQRLRAAVSDRSHRDLSPIDLPEVPGEVRPLVQEVNDLMARLEKVLDFQNRFVADAAHQLKTPVSGLKAQIELAAREQDPERVRHSLAQMHVSADRLSRLVRQLLALARNEPGALALQLEPLDLNAFALDVSMEWVPHALQRRIDLGFEGAGAPQRIGADRDRLRELINNLVDNAIRYSQPGGRVTVRVAAARDSHCRLSISDDGPSIPVAERARIFERFHRLLGTQEDGSGLGLAIVSEIATLHQAQIELEEDSDGVGNTFSVLFPLVPDGDGGAPTPGPPSAG